MCRTESRFWVSLLGASGGLLGGGGGVSSTALALEGVEGLVVGDGCGGSSSSTSSCEGAGFESLGGASLVPGVSWVDSGLRRCGAGSWALP